MLHNQPAPSLFIVGIGSSAGGLEALNKVLSHIPDDADHFAIIIAQHLSPDYKSKMVDLLNLHSKWEVNIATHNCLPQAKQVYINASGTQLGFKEGKIQVTKADRSGVRPIPSIDSFFKELAETCGERAIGVMLSGTGKDGTQGIISIKEQGGYTIAQTPHTSRHDNMPQSAISTGYCDKVIYPEAIAEEIDKYIHHYSLLKENPLPEDHWEGIFNLLTQRTKANFARYKRATLERRIAKRLSALRLNDLGSYYKYIQQHPQELDTLFQTMLIGVTRFFRDPPAFEALEEYIRKIILHAEADRTIRCWSVGCATGEEAYSLAILLSECMKDSEKPRKFQIFATDIDSKALTYARRGIYTQDQVAEVPALLLTKYFTSRDDGYEISKFIRQHVLFSRHNVLVDPPFNDIDLICCRNVLIYFSEALQKEVLPSLHHVLNPKGYLFLGKSESTGKKKNLFHVQDAKYRIYQRNNLLSTQHSATKVYTYSGQKTTKPSPPDSPSLTELAQLTLAKTFDSPYAIVNEELEVAEIKGSLQPYLELSEGELHSSLLKIIHPALHMSLRQTFQTAKEQQHTVTSSIVRHEVFGTEQYVRFIIKPVIQEYQEQLYFLVIFERIDIAERLPLSRKDLDRDDLQNARILELEDALAQAKQQLQSLTEQYEASSEELQTLNEELQSANEELKSSNEELETSNEELQSANEELITANAELEYSNSSLEKKDKELQASQENYRLSEERFRLALNSANIGVFNQDTDLLYTWVYNPNQHFGLDEALLGKTDYQLFYGKDTQLIELKKEVVRTAKAIQQVITVAEQYYDISINPIVEPEAVVGLITVSVDITPTIRSQQEIQQRESLQTALLQNYPSGMIFVFDTQLRYTLAGGQELEQYDLNEEEIIGRTPQEVFTAYPADSLKKLILRYQASLRGETTRGEEVIYEQVYSYHLVPIYNAGEIVAGLSVVQNITEQKRTQHILARKQAVLNNLVNNTEEGILAVNTNYEIIGINKAVQKFLEENYEVSLQEGDHLLEKLAQNMPDYHDPFREAFDRTFRGERFVYDYENKFRASWRHLEVTFTSLTDESGKVVGGAHFARDITRRVEESNIIKSIVEGSAQVSGKQYFEYLTEKLTQLFQSKYTYIGRLINNNNRIRTIALRQDGKLIPNFSYALKGVPCQHVANKDSTRHFEHVSKLFPEDEKLQRWNAESYVGVPITSPSGESLGVVVLINDTPWKPVPEADYLLAIFASRAGTELVRQEAEERIRRQERQLTRISRNVPEMIYEYIVRKTGEDQFVYVSDAAEEIYEVSAESLMKDANLAWQAIHPDDLHDFAEVYQLSALHMQRFQWEGRLITHQTQSTKWIKITATPEKRAEEVIKWYGIIDDITKQKEYEIALEQAKEEAERAAQAKEEFLATMSHEIRTPLNAIVGLSNLLLGQSPKPEQIENLNTLKFSSKNLMNIINDVLDFSKIEAGKVEVSEEDFNLFTLIRSLEQSHLPSAKDRGNDLQICIAKDVPSMVRGDEGKLVQILNNLLSNALKFTQDGQVTLTVDIASTEQKSESFPLMFSVSDTGIGIAKEKLDAIFEKFTQADSTTMRRYGGTGLGLAITKRLLSLMGSTIEVTSIEGQGATFSFTLPLKKPVTEETTDTTSPSSKITKAEPLNRLKLLIVEDESINRMVLQQYLQEWGIMADEAANGEKALEKVKSTDYDAILMDIRMPVMDGYETTRTIRSFSEKKYQNVPIIAFTADVSNTSRRTEASLFTGFITKPFNPDDLKNMLEQYVRFSPEFTEKDKKPTNYPEPKVDFSQAESSLDGDSEKKQHFYAMAIKAILDHKDQYQQAVQEKNPKKLGEMTHKAKMLFELLNLSTFHAYLNQQAKQIESGIDEQTRQTTIKRFDELIDQLHAQIQE